jgi:hypothetical protein
MQAMILCQDARQIIEASGVPITGWNRDGSSPIEYNPEGRLALNGVDDDGCETFVIDFQAPQDPGPDGDEFERDEFGYFLASNRRGSYFCKTRGRPYDAVVTAILLRAMDILPDMSVASDGDWADWAAGRALYFTVFGGEATCPWRV